MRYLFFFLLLAVSLTSHAQEPAPAPSPGHRVPDEAIDAQKEDRVEVDAEALPGPMREELAAGDQYDGWDESPVYFEQNTEQYIVTIVRDNTTRTFRFDRQGAPIVTDESIEEPGRHH